MQLKIEDEFEIDANLGEQSVKEETEVVWIVGKRLQSFLFWKYNNQTRLFLCLLPYLSNQTRFGRFCLVFFLS